MEVNRHLPTSCSSPLAYPLDSSASEAQMILFEEVEQLVRSQSSERYQEGIGGLYKLLTLCQNNGNLDQFTGIYTFLHTFLPHVKDDDLPKFEMKISEFLYQTPNFLKDQRDLAFELAKRYHQIANRCPIGSFADYKYAMYLYSKAASMSHNHPSNLKEIHQASTVMVKDLRKKYLEYRMDILIAKAVGSSPADYLFLQTIVNQAEKYFYLNDDVEYFKKLCKMGADLSEGLSATSDEALKRRAACIELFTLKGKGDCRQDTTQEECSIERYSRKFKTYQEVFHTDSDDFNAYQLRIGEAFRTFYKELWIEACSILAVDPKSAEPRAMGSVARNEQLPRSDLEWLIIVQQEGDIKVFQYVSEIVEILAISLGETMKNGWIQFSAAENCKGFCIDTCEVKTAQSFLSDLCLEEESFSPNSMANTLRDSSPLIRSENDTQDLFQLNVQKTLGQTLARKRATLLIDALIGQETQEEYLDKIDSYELKGFKTWWKRPFEQQPKIFLKDQYSNLIHHMVKSLGLYYGLQESNSFLLVDELQQKVFTPQSGKVLKQALVEIFKIRRRLQSQPGFQSETIDCEGLKHPQLLKTEKETLWKIYWFVLFPLYKHANTFLKEPAKPIDLLGSVFSYINEENPPNQLKLMEGLAPLLDEQERYYYFLSRDVQFEPLREAFLRGADVSSLYDIPNRDGFRRRLVKEQTSLYQDLMKLTSSEGTVEIRFAHDPGKTYYLQKEVAATFIGSNGVLRDQAYQKSLHPVARIQHQNVDVHIKEGPNYPLIEWAMRSLLSRIVPGDVTPAIELARIQGIERPVIFSQTIHGISLEEASLSNLDSKRLTWLMLCMILIRPGDGHINNCKVKNNQIVLFDNEVAGSEPVAKGVVDTLRNFFGATAVQFRSIIFCLDENFTLDEKVVEEFCMLDMYCILDRWLDDVIEKNKEYEALFNQRELKTLYDTDPTNRFSLAFLREGVVTNLNLQFKHLQEQLATNPKRTFSELLEMLISFREDYSIRNQVGLLVAKQYRRAFQNKKTPKERYEWVTGMSCSVSSLVSMKEMFEGIPDYKSIESKIRLSGEIAKEELCAFQLQSFGPKMNFVLQGKDVKSIQCSLEKIKNPHLEKLLLTALRYAFDRFGKIKPSFIFLAHSPQLDANKIQYFLHDKLTHLSLEYCPQVNDRTVQKIETACGKALEYLSLKGSVALKNFGKLFLGTQAFDFPNLKSLDVSDCSRFNFLVLKGSLKKISALNTPQYKIQGDFHSDELTTSSFHHALYHAFLKGSFKRIQQEKKPVESDFDEEEQDAPYQKHSYRNIRRNQLMGKYSESSKVSYSSVQKKNDVVFDSDEESQDFYMGKKEYPSLPDRQFITEIYMNNYGISLIDLEIKDFKNLKTMWVSHNNLENLPEEFGQLQNLEKLDLSHNKFKEIPLILNQLEKLKYLDISCNNLKIESLKIVDEKNTSMFKFSYPFPYIFNSEEHLDMTDLVFRKATPWLPVDFSVKPPSEPIRHMKYLHVKVWYTKSDLIEKQIEYNFFC